ncbi:MAG: hypothetical protein ACXIVF_14860 [Rhizobiaceae bacterium]
MDIFYFWEGRKDLPGYIELCIETWQNLPGAVIRRIDYTNVEELTDGLIAPARIARYPLAVQSDLISAALLARRGGLFLDADTIVLPGFDPARYSQTVCTLYGTPATQKGTSLAFVMAPKDNEFVCEWARRGLRALDGPGLLKRTYWDARKLLTGKRAKVPWDWMGPAIVDDLLGDPAFSPSVELRDQVSSGMYPFPALAGRPYGPDSYRQIMFSQEDRSHDILGRCRDGLLALQNSWHPGSVQALTAAQVLEGKSTLSRLLAHALAR